MRVAVPMFGSRVAPRSHTADEATIAEVADGAVISRTFAPLRLRDEAELVSRLRELDVDVLVTGGISREVLLDLEASGIHVIHNVAGDAEEVLSVFARDRLCPGYGLRRADTATRRPPRGLPDVDCIACSTRTCAAGDACGLDLGALGRPWLRGQEARIYEAGRDVSAEEDPKLCRIAELVHFGVELGYERIGVAFCWELFREVDSLVGVLSRFFSVVPVCCRIGAASGEERIEPPPCNPVAQARLLADARTELNVIAGLCLGCDLLFTRRSRAPVTTLFVKDRSLAHNPVGAIYTRYHLEGLVGRTRK